MKKRLFLLFFLLFALSVVQAQDENKPADKIPFVKLGANFSVPEIDWTIKTEDNAVLFTNSDFNAQIYVTSVDTQDLNEAIASTIPAVSSAKFDTPFAETRAGRTTGTWTVQLFKAGDTSVSAYAMLQSGHSYVVIFAEDSTNYEAYQFPVRPENLDPTADELESTIMAASDSALTSVFSQEATDAQITYPNSDSKYWLHAQYSDTLETGAFLYDGIVFVTLVQGDLSPITSLSNAFDTVFLGFVITPDNSQYLYLGLTFASVIMLALLGSMWFRYRNLQKDMALVEQLKEE